ncbi:MAG: 30S ribosomal protein S8 [Bdellovibrionales bacterium CG12_big_fil_rev_8_21_14_0_65_38_15]|nr:MAG: 30S ribosomal protein S8 [Bdellovibrionales bacterium CG22_combo_CG10-13_8_21_14_all_38_13]PIQ55437.1 MAG: 30S ribosomal protein S8 [Bdellovibrionales bacterium CG12_big_fil_rev_8_21_14_0_65_38_15]PIR29178.1 MAG: 30S ribosomal protein S8 [Bdellovibrionales bacterium CG11_big_fil_rev_8_21_14_0_20_38_13]
MMTDPIADMLTRIRNAISAGHDRVEIPASKMKAGICKVLKDEGFIKSFKIIAKSQADIKLKVVFKEGAIEGIQRVSTPGLRRYSSYQDTPRVMSGLGTSILSTSKGIVSTRDAKKLKIGGEVICNVW